MHIMNPKTVKLICTAMLVVSILLCLVASAANQGWPVVIALLLCIGAIVLDLIFYRCPECRRYLGRRFVNFCPFCGEDLDYY